MEKHAYRVVQWVSGTIGQIDAIVALRPDCVRYAPLHPDVGELSRILRAGINVVTPVGFVYQTVTDAEDFATLQAACEAGNSTLHGTGIHPRFSGDLLPLTLSRIVGRIEQIQVRLNGINTIPTVCNARPGMLTHLDLPFVTPRGLIRPRSEGYGEPIGI